MTTIPANSSPIPSATSRAAPQNVTGTTMDPMATVGIAGVGAGSLMTLAGYSTKWKGVPAVRIAGAAILGIGALGTCLKAKEMMRIVDEKGDYKSVGEARGHVIGWAVGLLGAAAAAKKYPGPGWKCIGLAILGGLLAETIGGRLGKKSAAAPKTNPAQ